MCSVAFMLKLAIGITFAVVLLKITSCTKVGLFALNATSRLDAQYVKQTNVAYGDNKRQKLDVFYAEDSTKPKPVVVFFYGGSWDSGSKSDYHFVAATLSQHGFVVVIPDYRLYPEVKFPGFVHDGADAVRWVQKNISEFNGDSGKIFVMGHSAGAHIAALLNFDQRYLKGDVPLAGFVGLAGPYDFLPLQSETLKKIFSPKEKRPESQPINHVEGREAPSLILHGKKDTTVWIHNAKNLSEKISKKGGQAQLKIYEGFDHVAIISKFSRVLKNEELVNDVVEFLKSH